MHSNINTEKTPTFTPVTSKMTPTEETIQFICSLDVKVNMLKIIR